MLQEVIFLDIIELLQLLLQAGELAGFTAVTAVAFILLKLVTEIIRDAVIKRK